MQRQGHGHSRAVDLGVFREQAVLGACRERGGVLGSLAQNQLKTRPVSAIPFFSWPPTAWQRQGWVRPGSECPFSMSPHSWC